MPLKGGDSPCPALSDKNRGVESPCPALPAIAWQSSRYEFFFHAGETHTPAGALQHPQSQLNLNLLLEIEVIDSLLT